MQETVHCQDRHTEKYVQSLLKCKPHLLSILTHWEPCHILPNQSVDKLNLATVTVPDKSSYLNSDKMPRLMTATAHTLIKWILRTLFEMPFDEYCTFATLKWLKKVVVPHDTIAKSLINDEALKADLLRLYHRTCEFKLQEKNPFKLETLEIFTTIMLHLLEVEKTLHINVIKACLHSTTDLVKRGNFLLCTFLSFFFFCYSPVLNCCFFVVCFL